MENRVEREYRSEDLNNYQRDILCGELCGLFLPVNFIENKWSLLGIYIADEYFHLTDAEKLTVCQGLDIVILLIGKIIDAERRYMFVGDYDLKLDNIYLNQNYSDVKIVFEKPRKEYLIKEDLIQICRFCSLKIETEKQSYMEKAAGYIERGHSSLGILRHRITELRREAFLCGYDE